MNSDLKLIKKKYGEETSHLCRELFPIILEQEGLLPKLLLDHFEANHFLYEDIVENDLVISFKNYIYSLLEVEIKKKIKVDKNPKEFEDEICDELTPYYDGTPNIKNKLRKLLSRKR